MQHLPAGFSFAGFEQLSITYQQGAAFLLLFVLIAEMLFRLFERRSLLPKDGLANFAMFVLATVIETGFGNAAVLASMFAAYAYAPWHIPVDAWTALVYFLVADLCFYLDHWAGHRIRLCWADHSIHHSSPEYDFTTNLRLTPFTWSYRIVTWAPLALLGFHPGVIWLLAMLTPSFQTFCHTTRVGKLGWFDKVFMSPTNHAVHHASNPIYIDKNYGGLTVIWDRLFGTYQPITDEPVNFGITKPFNSSNPFKIVALEFTTLFRDMAAAPSFREKMGVLYKPPGETFEVSLPEADERVASMAKVGQ